MENLSSHNTSLSSIDIKDAIFSKMQQSKAIITCVMFATEFIRDDMRLGNATLYHALWAVDHYLEELGLLLEQLEV
jgi:hypothetical protein